MPELLCLSHQGVRCAIPLRRISGADKASAHDDIVCLWGRRGSPRPHAPRVGERVFQVTTVDGPLWINGSNPTLHSVPAVDIWRLTPLLRELLPLPHVVGIAEIKGELVWLVDPTRFSPIEVNTSSEIAV